MWEEAPLPVRRAKPRHPAMLNESYTLGQKCVAEAAGVAIIVGGGCGAVCAAKYAACPLSHLGVSLVFGTAVTSAVFVTRDVSGAHLNPAITAAFAVHRPEYVRPDHVLPYVAAQLGGGAAAAALNYRVYRRGIAAAEATLGLPRGTPGSCAVFDGAFGLVPNRAVVGPGVRSVLAGEAGMTAALTFAIFAFTDPEKSVSADAAPVLIGATVAALAAQYGAVTGCGMNPARDLGPRLVTACAGWGRASLSQAWWAYTVGPMAGALVGGALYDWTLKRRGGGGFVPMTVPITAVEG